MDTLINQMIQQQKEQVMKYELYKQEHQMQS